MERHHHLGRLRRGLLLVDRASGAESGTYTDGLGLGSRSRDVWRRQGYATKGCFSLRLRHPEVAQGPQPSEDHLEGVSVHRILGAVDVVVARTLR